MFFLAIFDYLISSSDYMVSLSPHTSITIVCACQTAMDDVHKMQHDLRKMQYDLTIPKCTS